MTNKKISDRIRVKRLSDRASYKRKDIYAIVDAALICHVGFAIDDQPFVIPMACAREGDFLYLHGPTKGRIMGHLTKGSPACVTVTHLDGLVLAKSHFHHSMNYRSAVLFGTCEELSGREKEKALEHLVRHLSPGQESYARPGNSQEMKATSVLRFHIEEASAKVRKGPPEDAREDLGRDLWSGEITLKTIAEDILPNPDDRPAKKLPQHIRYLFQRLKG